jgi:hypothetical protein
MCSLHVAVDQIDDQLMRAQRAQRVLAQRFGRLLRAVQRLRFRVAVRKPPGQREQHYGHADRGGEEIAVCRDHLWREC